MNLISRLRVWPVALATILLLGLTFTFTSSLSAQDDNPLVKPYLDAANQAPSLADAPLEIIAWSETKHIGGFNKHIGWTPRISGRILGHTRNGDAVFIEFSQNGKLLKKFRVGLRGITPAANAYLEDFNFSGDSEKDLISEVGNFDVAFSYYDDNTEETRLLAKRKFTAINLVYYDDSQNKWKFGYLCDDLQGFSYLFERPANDSYRVWFYSWIALNDDNQLKDITYRIEVNGTRIDLPADFAAFGNHTEITGLEQEERFFLKAEKNVVNHNYKMNLITFRPYLCWGPKPNNPMENTVYMIDHPGKWVVKIRVGGEVMRELRFTVGPDGVVLPHPEQDPGKAGFMNLGPYRIFCETYFPNPITLDWRFNPDAIKAGTLYGRPWISDEVKNGMLPSLPAKKVGPMVFPQPTLPPVK